MKIILFGLLVAVLVVYGYAEDNKDKHDESVKRFWEQYQKDLDDIKHAEDLLKRTEEDIARSKQRMKDSQIEFERTMQRINEEIEKLKNRG